MKQLKDYLPFYLGCEMLCIKSNNGDYEYKGRKVKLTLSRLSIESGKYLNTETWKPILRPLSDMTEEEYDYLADKFLDDIIWSPATIYDFVALVSKKLTIYKIAEITQYLLSKHFDLFGLVESGLAIDKTLLTLHV